MAVVSEDPDPPRRAGMMWPVISGLLAADQSRRLGYAGAEQMLRRVAESGAATVTAPMPAADQLPGPDVTGAVRGKSQASLNRAGRTRALHSLASPGPDPPSGSLQPPDRSQPSASPRPLESPEPHRPDKPAEPAVARQRLEVSVASHVETDEDTAVTPRTGFPVLLGSFPAQAEPSAAPAHKDNGAAEPRRRRIRLLALAVALVAAAGVPLGLYLANRPPAGSSASGRPGQSASAPARSRAATPGTPRTRTQPGTATSPRSRSTPPVAKSSTPPKFGDQANVPPGYHTYRDPTGFSIAMPNGWNVSHQGHYVYLTPPSGASYLLIDQSGHPQSNPLADWQQQEANRRTTYAGYKRIRLVAIHYPQAEKAADWEFTYYHGSVLTHVLNRNILANAQHAYALYWSTPESTWSSEYPIFEVLARTFQPARPTS